MELTKEMYDKLPLSKYPIDYDETDVIINEALKDFDEYADRIESQYSSESCVSKRIVAEKKSDK
ncbi:MAG: hypothetical protein IKP21_06385 [Bacteroidales bacterium]|nr:hypothetical protein [Bacteroidales bacterium]